jgi:hypothetical protein
VSHTYLTIGAYHASLVVKDSRGKSSVNVAEAVIEALAPGDFYTVTPCRLLDTRTPEDGGAPVPSDTDRVLEPSAVTRCGVSPFATSVALNVSIVGPTAGGHLVVYPNDLAEPPATASINFSAEQTRANNLIAGLCADGMMKLRPGMPGGGSVHLVVDVVGFFIQQ